MSGVIYIGKRTNDGCVVKIFAHDALKNNPRFIDDLQEGEDLPLRLDIHSHSPDGFEWGYGGSGPSQLALALIAHAMQDDELTKRLYPQFRDVGIATIQQDMWMLSSTDIQKWVESFLEIERWVAYGQESRDPQKTSTIVGYSGNA